MARKAKPIRTAKPAVRKRRPTLSITTGKRAVAKKTPTLKKAPAASKRATSTRARATPPRGSQNDLRTRLEKLELDNKTLLDQGKEAGEATRAAAARIAQLEEQVARLESKLAAESTAAEHHQAAASKKSRQRTRHQEIDPGDSVPPGVAVEEPAEPDLAAETARENLEAHLGGSRSDVTHTPPSIAQQKDEESGVRATSD